MLSMRKVASCVGVSATAIYRHFSNKEELLYHVVLRGFSLFSDYLEQAENPNCASKQLSDTIDAYLKFALNETSYYVVIFMSGERVTGLKKLNDDNKHELHNTFVTLKNRVEAAMLSGDIKSSNSHQTAFAIWAFAHGQIALFIDGKTGLSQSDFEALYDQLMTDYIKHL